MDQIQHPLPSLKALHQPTQKLFFSSSDTEERAGSRGRGAPYAGQQQVSGGENPGMTDSLLRGCGEEGGVMTC